MGLWWWHCWRYHLSKLALMLIFQVLLLHTLTHAISWTWISGQSFADITDHCGAQGVGLNFPSARYGTSLTRCPENETNVYLLGGFIGNTPDDNDYECGEMWQFDLVSLSWSIVINESDTQLTSRIGAVLWCDTYNTIRVFAGYNFNTNIYLSDLWKLDWDTLQWIYVSGSSDTTTSPDYVYLTPGGRYEPATALNSEGCLYMYSGFYTFSDLWFFNISTDTWSVLYYDQGDVTVPQPLFMALMSFDQEEMSLTVGLGFNHWVTTDPGRLWKYDIKTSSWTIVYSGSSLSRPDQYGEFSRNNSIGHYHGFLYWTHNQNVYVAMGDYDRGDESNDLWVWSTTINQWSWIDGSRIFSDMENYAGYFHHHSFPEARTEPSRSLILPRIDTSTQFFYGGRYDVGEMFSDFWMIDLEDDRCKNGEFYSLGGSKCYQCEDGKFSYGNVTSCQECTANTPTWLCVCQGDKYFNGSICEECSNGTHYYNNSCITCEAGSIPSGQQGCLECHEGTYSNKTHCIQCRDGTYASSTGSTICLECVEGTYSNKTHCIQCRDGTYASSTGSTICLQCHEGYEPSMNQTACIPESSAIIVTEAVVLGISITVVTTTAILTSMTTSSSAVVSGSASGEIDSTTEMGQFCALIGMINDRQSSLSVAFGAGFSWMIGIINYPFLRSAETDYIVNHSVDRYLNIVGISRENVFTSVIVTYSLMLSIVLVVFSVYACGLKSAKDRSLENPLKHLLRTLIRIMRLMYSPITLVSLLEIWNVFNGYDAHLISAVLALAIGTFLIYIVFLIGYKNEAHRRNGKTCFSAEVLKILYNSFKDDRKWYLMIILFLRFLRVCCVVFLVGILQVFAFSMIQIISLILLLILRPYLSKETQLVKVAFCIGYVCVCILQVCSFFTYSGSVLIDRMIFGIQIAMLSCLVLWRFIVQYRQLRSSKRENKSSAMDR